MLDVRSDSRLRSEEQSSTALFDHSSVQYAGRVRFMPHWFLIARRIAPWFVILAGCYLVLAILQLQPSALAAAAWVVPYVLLVIGFGFAVSATQALVLWRFSIVDVYSDRIEYRVGLLSRRLSTVELSEIANIDIDQTLLQRFFGFGDMMIDSRSSSILTIRSVAEIRALQDLIRSRRGALILR